MIQPYMYQRSEFVCNNINVCFRSLRHWYRLTNKPSLTRGAVLEFSSTTCIELTRAAATGAAIEDRRCLCAWTGEQGYGIGYISFLSTWCSLSYSRTRTGDSVPRWPSHVRWLVWRNVAHNAIADQFRKVKTAHEGLSPQGTGRSLARVTPSYRNKINFETT